MPARSEEPEADLRSKRSALLRVLTATRTLAAQVTFYAAALGAVALVGGATLPPELQFFAGAVGADILAGLITRLAQGESVPDEEIREQVEAAIAQSDLAGALAQQETQAMIGQLFSRMHLLHYALANGQADIAERLATQAAQYQTLFAGLQGTVDRIDETTARIDANVSALLHRIQPPVDSAQQLVEALALLGSLPLDEVPPVGTLPPGSRPALSPNPLFVGRSDDLRALAKILKGGDTAAVGQVAAATGLGGIGKTQLAVEFAHRYGRFFAGGVFWLSCADPNAVATEVVACGLAMGLPGFEVLDFPTQVQRVRSVWQEPIPRLLIFDNCEEEAVLAEWRPTTGGCRVLVTSRRASWSVGLGVRSLALPVLQRAESVALLRRFRGDLDEDDPVLDAIAEELGDLPLALHLAGSFLARYRHDVTPTVYVDQLCAPGLLAHRSLIAGDWLPTGHEAHVARTFALSYDRLDPDDSVDALALALLSRLACFAPGEQVPRGLLLLTLERDVAGSDYEVADALRRLAELGLVDGQEDGAVVLHRLVAAFVLALPGSEEAQGAVERALGKEAGRLNETGLPALLLPWQAHLRYVTNRALARGDVQAALLCNQLGSHLNQAGSLSAALHYLEQALVLYRQTLGEAHLSTATSLNNLGMLLQAMGDLPAARPYLEQALAITRQALGEAHPSTATSLANFGSLLQAMGDLLAARPYLEQDLAICRQTLGEAHPDTATSRNNLGTLLFAMRDLPAAQAYLEQALAIRRQTLGEAHPSTAISFGNVGFLLNAMGDLPAARPYYEQALTIAKRSLGADHPTTRIYRRNLEILLDEMGTREAPG